jgi:hypothetical protein
MVWKLVQHVPEVVQDQSMTVPTPPVRDHPVREDDQVAGLLIPVNHDPAEAVLIDLRHGTQTMMSYFSFS